MTMTTTGPNTMRLSGVSSLEVVWTQAEETAQAKAEQRPPARRQEGPTRAERIAFWLETHPDAMALNISAATGIGIKETSTILRKLTLDGRIVASGRNEWPRRPFTWKVVE